MNSLLICFLKGSKIRIEFVLLQYSWFLFFSITIKCETVRKKNFKIMSVFEFPILSLVRKQYSLICCRYLTIYIVTLNELNSHIILELFPKIKF